VGIVERVLEITARPRARPPESKRCLDPNTEVRRLRQLAVLRDGMAADRKRSKDERKT
jgi:hypothetical protein